MFDSCSKEEKKKKGGGWGVLLEHWSQTSADLGLSPSLDPSRLFFFPPFVIASSVASSSKQSERLKVALLGKESASPSWI